MLAKSDKWLITLTVMMGTIMSALDSSIVNVALPYMRGTLGASVEEITWVVTGYILSSVIIMPIVGMLSARYGRKNFYLFSIVSFTVSSMLCGMAWDLTSMVVFRLLQGIGGGVLIPVSQAILRETFPREEQGKAMGIYGFGVVLGARVRPDPWRLAHGPLFLALDILHQRADRRSQHPHGHAVHQGPALPRP